MSKRPSPADSDLDRHHEAVLTILAAIRGIRGSVVAVQGGEVDPASLLQQYKDAVVQKFKSLSQEDRDNLLKNPSQDNHESVIPQSGEAVMALVIRSNVDRLRQAVRQGQDVSGATRKRLRDAGAGSAKVCGIDGISAHDVVVNLGIRALGGIPAGVTLAGSDEDRLSDDLQTALEAAQSTGFVELHSLQAARVAVDAEYVDASAVADARVSVQQAEDDMTGKSERDSTHSDERYPPDEPAETLNGLSPLDAECAAALRHYGKRAPQKNLTPTQQFNLVCAYWTATRGLTPAKIRREYVNTFPADNYRLPNTSQGTERVKKGQARGVKLLEKIPDA